MAGLVGVRLERGCVDRGGTASTEHRGGLKDLHADLVKHGPEQHLAPVCAEGF